MFGSGERRDAADCLRHESTVHVEHPNTGVVQSFQPGKFIGAAAQSSAGKRVRSDRGGDPAVSTNRAGARARILACAPQIIGAAVEQSIAETDLDPYGMMRSC